MMAVVVVGCGLRSSRPRRIGERLVDCGQVGHTAADDTEPEPKITSWMLPQSTHPVWGLLDAERVRGSGPALETADSLTGNWHGYRDRLSYNYGLSMTRIANTEGDVDTLNVIVYCDDSASVDGLNAAEAKCQNTVAKTRSNFAAKKLKCLSKCRSDEHKGKIPAGSCPPPPSASKASGCITQNTTKATALIDKKCDAAVHPRQTSWSAMGRPPAHLWLRRWRWRSTTAMPACTAARRAEHSSTERSPACGPSHGDRSARPNRT
jgi:hypothetical protein